MSKGFIVVPLLVLIIVVLASGLVWYTQSKNNSQSQSSYPVLSSPSPLAFSYPTPSIISSPQIVSPTPVLSTLPPQDSQAVSVLVSSSSYSQGQTILLTLKNNTQSDISFYGPVCGIFFERKRDGGWQVENVNKVYYGSEAQCSPSYSLGAGKEDVRKLVIDANPPQGTYHIGFKTTQKTFYSSEFTID